MIDTISWELVPTLLQEHPKLSLHNQDIRTSRYSEVLRYIGPIPEPTHEQMTLLWDKMVNDQLNIVDFEQSHQCVEYFPDHNMFTVGYDKAQSYLQYVHAETDTDEYLRYYPSVYWSGQLMTRFPKFFQRLEGIQHYHHYHHKPQRLFPLVWAYRETAWLARAHEAWDPTRAECTPENWLIHVFSFADSHERRL